MNPVGSAARHRVRIKECGEVGVFPVIAPQRSLFCLVSVTDSWIGHFFTRACVCRKGNIFALVLRGLIAFITVLLVCLCVCL